MTFLRAVGDSRFLFSWTERSIAQLRELAGAKRSASEIAKVIGGGVTRSAVCGKAHRLGIKIDSGKRGLARPKQPRRTPSRATFPGAQVNGSGKHALDCRAREGGANRHTRRRSGEVGTAAAAERSAAALNIVAQPLRLTIDALRETSCRWPIGDPSDLDTFRYCGAEKAGPLVYCCAHARMAYQPRAA